MAKKNVVYLHVKKGTNDVFYVGIGSKRRAYSTNSRNAEWHKIVNKFDYEVRIINKDLSVDDSRYVEKELIQAFGRKDGQLCNITAGGQSPWNKGVKTGQQPSKAFSEKCWNRGIKTGYYGAGKPKRVVIINNDEYGSIQAASDARGISRFVIMYRCKSKTFKNYNYG